MRTSIFRMFEHEPTIGWQWIYRPSIGSMKISPTCGTIPRRVGFPLWSYHELHSAPPLVEQKLDFPNSVFGSSFKRYQKKKRKSHNPRSFHQRKFQQKIIKNRRYQRTRTNPPQLRIRSARMAPLQCVEPRVSKVSPFWGNRRFHRSFTDFFSFPPVGWSSATQALVIIVSRLQQGCLPKGSST